MFFSCVKAIKCYTGKIYLCDKDSGRPSCYMYYLLFQNTRASKNFFRKISSVWAIYKFISFHKNMGIKQTRTNITTRPTPGIPNSNQSTCQRQFGTHTCLYTGSKKEPFRLHLVKIRARQTDRTHKQTTKHQLQGCSQYEFICQIITKIVCRRD